MVTCLMFPGKGPFPGVVDMFGGQVDLVEARAGLLASHGFAAFALAYLMLDETLPKSTEDADFKYVDVSISSYRSCNNICIFCNFL